MSQPVPVLMPQMGESLAEGTLVRWLKSVGDPVLRDEPLVEISTDKVDTEVPAPVAGVLRQVLVKEGETVEVGTTMAMIEPAGAAGPASSAPETGAPARREEPHRAADAETRVSSESLEAGADEPAGHFSSTHATQLVSFRRGQPPSSRAAAASPGDEAPRARVFSPAVLGAARQAGLSLETLTRVRGSGRGGRITKKDVEAFVQSERASHVEGASGESSDVPTEYVYRPTPEDRVVPMTAVRRRIAKHMAWSARISPQASAFVDCDMSRAADLIDRHRAPGDGAPLTFTVLIAAAAVEALAEFAVLNTSVVGDALVYKPHVNLGIAVALPETDELIVPVVHRADTLSTMGLAEAIHDLAMRARTRKLRPEDVQGGSFTLTNPGPIGGAGGIPVLNQPQVAILAVGAVAKRAVVVNDAIAIRSVATFTLTFDHRAADGLLAFRYLDAVRRRLESLGREQSKEQE